MADIVSGTECETILRCHFRANDFQLIEYKTVPLSDAVEGFLGEHYIVKTKVKRFNDIQNVSFFAKVPPFKYNLQLEYTVSSSAFEKEIFLYENLVKEFKIYCPTFDSGIVPNFYYSRENNLVVMENLQEKGFRVAPFDDVMDVKHIKLILKILAKFHSASLIYEEKKTLELGKQYRLMDNYAEFLEEAFFRNDKNYLGYKWHEASSKGLAAIIDMMDPSILEISREEFKKKVNTASERCFEIVKPSKKFRNVCCHGDLWRKNVLFKYENGYPSDCKLIDFQLMKYSPPAFDVLKIIYQSTRTDMRQHHFEDFLKFYYDSLCKELTLGDVDASTVLSRDQFQASIKYMLPQCKIETSYYHSYQKPGPEYLKKLMEDPEAFRKYTFLDRGPFMVKEYKDGSVYKEWMDEILLDIKDMVVHAGFTREDCHAILRSKLNTTNYELVKYAVKPVTEKSGFLGEHVKIHMDVKYKETNKKLSFFAKFLPESAFSSFVITSGAFNNEKFIFDHVFQKMRLFGISEINKSVPKCYFSRADDILVFEDLNELGFETVNKHKPLDYDQVCVVIKSLAQFHASVLILEEKLSTHNARNFRVETQYYNDLKEVNYVTIEGHLGLAAIKSAIKGIYAAIDLFPDPESPLTDLQFKNIVKELYKNKMYNLVGPSKKYRNVICHGDLWANNIMIKYLSANPVECKIVDFQCVRLCPPAHDVMSLIYLTTSRKFRANFMSEIIKLYHSEMGNCLNGHELNVEKILPLEEFLQSCEEYKVYAIVQATTHFPIVMLSAEAMEELFTDEKLCHNTMFVDRTEFVKKMCHQNQHYKTMLGESIKDLRILCENLQI